MSLFQEIASNRALRFVDEHQSDKVISLDQLKLIELHGNIKQLAFLYLNNSLDAVTKYLSFLKSPHAIALLSPGLGENLKEELEKKYEPFYIFDPTRDAIEGYNGSDEKGLWQRNNAGQSFLHSELKLLLSTSGTTGSPKFVKLSEQNLLANARSIVQYLPINDKDVTPLNLPIYYSYGLSVLNSNALGGGTIFCTNTDILNKHFWSQMQLHGFTSIAGVPFVYEMLNRIGFTKKLYPSLRYFTQAGGKLQESLVLNFARYALENDLKFFVMYGQTEATARMSYLPPEETLKRPTSIGVAIPNGKFGIDEETGELKYAGPNIFGGYATCLSDLSSFNTDNWLNTGDLARKDNDGFIYITGRIKRFVKLFGNRINMDEVELLIAKHFGTIVHCLGIEDKLMLLVSQDNDILISAAEFVCKELKLHPTVVKTFHCINIPLTANGKPDYSQMRKRYEQK